MSTTEVIHVPREEAQIVRAEDFMPVFGIEQAVARQKAMSSFIGQILHESTADANGDYGVIPGTKGKVLLKPGAEKLCTFFGLSPRFTAEAIIEDWTGEKSGGEPLFYYRYKCELYRGDRFIAEAVGSANSREKKWRYRSGQRVCPSCGQPALIQGKQFKSTDPKEWLCWAKKGGCGSKFPIDDPQITGQEVGQVLNPDIFDQVNAMQKIAQKRALVASVLIGTNASDSFTQDLEEDAPPPPAAEEKGGVSSERGPRAGGAARAKGAASAPASAPQAPPEGVNVDDYMPPKREVPEDLRDAVAKVRAGDFGVVKMACDFIQGEFGRSGGPDGEAEFFRIWGLLRARFPKGTAIPPEDMVATWLDMWDALTTIRSKADAAKFAENVSAV